HTSHRHEPDCRELSWFLVHLTQRSVHLAHRRRWRMPIRPPITSRIANSTWRGLQRGSVLSRRRVGTARTPWAKSNCVANNAPSTSRCTRRTVRLRSFTLAKVRLCAKQPLVFPAPTVIATCLADG